MSDKSFDDFLKQTLQQSSQYIDDDNFTARVMAGLPAPHRLNPWLERLIVALPVGLIALWVIGQLPWRDLVRPIYGWLLTVDGAGLITLGASAMLVAAVIPLLWLLRRAALI